MEKKESKETMKDVYKMVKIEKPLKDFHIVHNQWDIQIIEGEPAEVPKKFLQNLQTEGVIKSIPK